MSFYDGATLLNAAPAAAVAGGKAAATLSSLAVGAHNITAAYTGDANFLAVTSASMAVDVLSPEFSVSASPAAQAILPPHSTSYTVTLTPVNATFVYPVTLSATELPTGVTAGFAPASIVVGSGTTTSVLTLNAAIAAQMHKPSHNLSEMPGTSAWALVALPLAFCMRRSRCQRPRWSGISIALFAAALLGALAGCGGGGFFSHSSQTSRITISAAGGPVTHSTTITLTVQ